VVAPPRNRTQQGRRILAMKAILADQNAEGHVAALVRILQREPWREFWADLNLSVFTFADLGLLGSVADSILWHACQQQGVD
jgi:hypothetical protein